MTRISHWNPFNLNIYARSLFPVCSLHSKNKIKYIQLYICVYLSACIHVKMEKPDKSVQNCNPFLRLAAKNKCRFVPV